MSSWRNLKNLLFYRFTQLATLIALITLIVLIFHIFQEGLKYLNWDLLQNFPSRFPNKAGIKPAIYGSLWLMLLTASIAVPFGVLTAIYLQEYAPKNRYTRWIQINIGNLAGMPSIIYGLLGLAVFVRFMDLDRSIISGALTLSLLILPVIIITSQEAIKAVPKSLRFAAFALGAERYQVIFGQILPAALPGILTGVILSLSRAIGETAPLIMVGAVTYISFVPESISDPFTVLPLQIFGWSGRPQVDFHSLAASAIIVLLVMLFTLNLSAILIRNRFQRYKL